jgi:serine protease Do
MSLDHLFANLRTRKMLSSAVILFTLALGVVIGTVITGAVGAARDQIAPGATPLSIPAPAALSSEFVKVAKMVEPSVVNINVESVVKAQPMVRRRRGAAPQGQVPPGHPGTNPNGANPNQDEGQDFLDRFFGGGQGESAEPSESRQHSLGSGIVVDPKGYILTNRHVVNADGDKPADRIRVKIPNDPTQYEAKVIGTDKETDLAVIKIEPKHALIAAKMGNSDGMSVGDWVLAFGSPFGLEATVTAGIISAKGRDVGGTFQHFLQTDAAINPGNSGGPLVNIAGEVIGVNTAIITSRGSYEGVGFALPSAMAVSVYNQLIKNGKVMRGSIGIYFSVAENPSIQKIYANNREGVLIQSIIPGTPADKVGLKAEDVILSVDGTPTRTGNELVTKISETPVGNKVKIHLLRDGKEMDFNVEVGDRTLVTDNDEPKSSDDLAATPKEVGSAKFGITIQGLTPELAEKMGAPAGTEGVVITNVDSGSFAEDIGLQQGDVIQALNKQPVKKNADITAIQQTLKSGDAVAFKVLRRQPPRGLQSAILGGQLP